MKLELATFPVEDVKFGNQTRYQRGILELNKDELVKLILDNKMVASADLDIAFPGEQTRIVKVRDAVEPRIKVSGPGCIFPGIMGPLVTVGEGKTNRLSGVTVMPSAEYSPTIIGGTAAQASGMVDMWGPGAHLTPFGKTINIVPLFQLVEGVSEIEAHNTIQMIEFKIAHRLAETTLNLKPQKIQAFELFEVDPSLPRVVCIQTILTTWHEPHSGVAYYGLPIRESLSTLLHPNELFDGALTTDNRRGSGVYETTWTWQNHPVLHELFDRHGKELNFLGIIAQRVRFESEFGKRITGLAASQMAKLLGADGAIILRHHVSGNTFTDIMLTVQACEKKGIKTVLMTPEWGGKGSESPLVFYVPEATAMVSNGSFERDIKVPVPTKIIGVGDYQLVEGQDGDKPFSPIGELTLPSAILITSGIDWFGYLDMTSIQY